MENLRNEVRQMVREELRHQKHRINLKENAYDIKTKIIFGSPLSDEELHVNGDLDLRNAKKIKQLPDGLYVSGNLNLENTRIKQLPSGLYVGGTLNISKTPIKTLPSDLIVGHLDAHGSAIKILPDGFRVDGNVRLSNCIFLGSLPNGFYVGGELNVNGCSKLTSFPKGLKVGKHLFAFETYVVSVYDHDETLLKASIERNGGFIGGDVIVSLAQAFRYR